MVKQLQNWTVRFRRSLQFQEQSCRAAIPWPAGLYVARDNVAPLSLSSEPHRLMSICCEAPPVCPLPSSPRSSHARFLPSQCFTTFRNSFSCSSFSNTCSSFPYLIAGIWSKMCTQDMLCTWVRMSERECESLRKTKKLKLTKKKTGWLRTMQTCLVTTLCECVCVCAHSALLHCFRNLKSGCHCFCLFVYFCFFLLHFLIL